MFTGIIMTASALLLGLAGIILTFMPQEFLFMMHIGVSNPSIIIIQILGALYFAFAMLNWMIKKSIIGGIYNRPIAVANFTHFTVAGLALIKSLFANKDAHYIIRATAIIYSVFAVAFGMMLFTHSLKESK